MTYSTTRRNPYIIGRPIDEPELIFGREALFAFIEDNLRQNIKVILLHGQRRIGKSSVLRNIPNFVAPNDFVFVPFDLQDQSGKSLSNILETLATEILDYLELDQDNIKLPLTTDLEKDPYIFSSQFLPQVLKELQDKKLVLLLDEFDSLTTQESNSLVKNIFPYLRNITLQNNLFIILLVGQKPEELPTILEVFQEAPIQEIGLLDELSAKRLITKLAQGVLEYEPDAIRAILELSAGHPYFTQVICFALFGRARELQNWTINRKDVEGIVDKAIELAEAGLAWFWNGLSIPEQVVFSAVAQAQQDSKEALILLQECGVRTEQLVQALQQLTKDGLLDNTGHRVKVELIRRWLVKRYPLRQVIWQLEKLEEEKVNFLFKQARVMYEQGETQNALAVYEQILKLNPNHFSTVMALAQGYFEIDEFDKAIKLYTRVYQADPARYKDGLLRALATYGEKLLAQRDLTQAKEQFERILEIDNENSFAWEKLQEVFSDETESTILNSQTNFLAPIATTHSRRGLTRTDKSNHHSHKSYNLLFFIAAIGVATGILSLIGIGAYRVSTTPCPAGQQKVFFVGCKLDERKISRGERTFFPNIKNPAREQGIEAFEQRKYPEAAGYFKTATTANRSDPEVLIYYNNTRAKQQRSPFTLAVVVPAKQEGQAQEILRGVAQAQNQFNEKRGLNGRLLEIAIANDDNEQYNAKQVAAELEKDPSVLAVIGHNTSDATEAALDTYKKASLAIISPTSSSPLLNDNDNRVFFRTVPSDAATGEKLATYAKKSLGINNVVIFYDSGSSYSNSLREAFTRKFEDKLNGKVVRRIDLTNSELNPTAEVASSVYAKEYPALAVVLFPDTQTTPDALKVVVAVAQRNTRLRDSNNSRRREELKLLGGDTLYSDTTLQQSGKDIEGLILAVPWFRDAPKSKKFAQEAAKQWGGQISWRTATSFDATQALIKALSASASRSTVLRRLQDITISSSETSGETVEFDSDGERQTQPVLIKVVGGKFELVNE
ncbi:ABC transporter substrate-binding protein [Mastigocladopsis repens]|uniref:ABC transporter substrate-binding protein n=1 Tax=Mastigocladopsis repens TaxID=221287 RepID=UPI0002F444A0|nr:ABC transporter substrate-binding protein [Mastigocladopsis repens]